MEFSERKAYSESKEFIPFKMKEEEDFPFYIVFLDNYKLIIDQSL